MGDCKQCERGARTASDSELQRDRLMRQAYEVGPETVLLIERLWKEALQQATWCSLELFDLARFYSARRLERAIAHAVARGLADLNGLRTILEENLDISEGQSTDPYRQLLLPLTEPELPEILPQSGNAAQSAAIPRTGSRR